MASFRLRGNKYYFAFRDEHGRRIEKPGDTHLGQTRAMAAAAEARVSRIKQGLVDPAELARADHDKRSLVDHADDWLRDMQGRDLSDRHPRLIHYRVVRLINLAKMERISDITPSRVQAALNLLRDGGKGVSLRTIHHYTSNVKQFCRWLWRDGRVKADPIAHLAKPNCDIDRRHERRSFTADELERLFAAARQAATVSKTSGADRESLYRIAVGTGFRLSELASLEPESFDLDANPPCVTVEAGYSKRRRRDVQPIRRDLADWLSTWLQSKTPREKLFPHIKPTKSSGMIRRDLAAARIPYADEDGRYVDFHSLRHTYISQLARSNAPFKVVQTLARHSTPSLTFNSYAHIGLRDSAAALESLPAVEPESTPIRPTGTEGDTC